MAMPAGWRKLGDAKGVELLGDEEVVSGKGKKVMALSPGSSAIGVNGIISDQASVKGGTSYTLMFDMKAGTRRQRLSVGINYLNAAKAIIHTEKFDLRASFHQEGRWTPWRRSQNHPECCLITWF